MPGNFTDAHGCQQPGDSLLVQGEEAVVNVGFTAPACSIILWAPTTAPISYLILTPASLLPTMALSQNESHLIPSLWFFLRSLFFFSYFVMPSHTPVSSALIVDAISSPPAKQSHAPFPIWHSIPDCFDLFLCCCCAQVGSFWALEGSSAVLSAGPRAGTQAEGSPASTLHFPG